MSSYQIKSAGTVLFTANKDIGWRSKWPLPPGKYVAALLRDDDTTPWSVMKTSAAFTVHKPPFGPTAVDLTRKAIRDLIRDDIALAAKFLRMAFHDSVGGADGCVSGLRVHYGGGVLVSHVVLLWSD